MWENNSKFADNSKTIDMRLHKIFLSTLLLGTALIANAGLTFSGLTNSAISIKPDSNSGLDEIYVVYPGAPVTVTYQAGSSAVTWQKFDSRGGGFASDMTGVTKTGNNYSVTLPQEDIGFIITEGTRPHYYWIVNYSNHIADIQSITPRMDEGECDRASIIINGNLEPIKYYSINGRAIELSREIEVTYHTMDYVEEGKYYTITEVTENIESTTGTIHVAAPLCDTQFTVTADRFLKQWGMAESVTSETLSATAVAATCSAEQPDEEKPDNEQTVEASLGGSAPADITFTAAITDAAIFHEWQFSNTAEFEDIYMRVNELEFTQTFTEAGTTYVRFVASNAAGECYAYSDVYEIFIGESQLLCPNAFSPGGSEGINDIWKVSYKSIVSFECHIFNRWGNEIISFNDPAQGWDGKKGGKLVPSGVYYYVIKAVGSDGKKYNLSGDINIINSKQSVGTGASTEEPIE